MKTSSTSRIKSIACFAAAMAFATCGLAGCTGGSPSGSDGQTDGTDYSYLDINIDEMNLEYSKKDIDDSFDVTQVAKVNLADNATTVEGDGMTVDGDLVSINAAGDYLVSGSFTNGQIVVRAGKDDKVHLILNGVSITNENGPAIYVENADKTIITAERNTDNFVSDTGAFISENSGSGADAAIFAKDDISFNGSGNLTVTSAYKHAIATNDDFVSTMGGTMTLTSGEKGDGIHAKDSVKILSGTYNINAGDDAIQVTKDNDGTKGFVAIDGGTYNIEAKNNGVKGETVVFVNGGDINIICSEEGLEAEQVIINDGNVVVNSSDDGINATVRDSVKEAYDIEDSEEPDMIADKFPVGHPQGGEKPTNLPEGTEAPAKEMGRMAPAPGEENGDAKPEGEMNPGDMNKGAAPDMPQGDKPEGTPQPGDEQTPDAQPGHVIMPGAYEGCLVQINGGTVTINAMGDGIDSNGRVEINGGILVVNEESGRGDSALDFEYSAEISGGVVWLMGAMSPMADDFTGGSQGFVSFSNVNGTAGSTLEVRDGNGVVVGSMTAAKAFSQVIFSSPDVQQDGSYTLYVNGVAQQ